MTGLATLRARLAALAAHPGTPVELARGAAAGALAGATPLFGAHLVLAVALAFAVRGSKAVAAAACLLVGNPLTHPVLIAAGYEVGRWLFAALGLPAPPPVHPDSWRAVLHDAVPYLEETTLGMLAIGLPVAAALYYVVLRLARARAGREL